MLRASSNGTTTLSSTPVPPSSSLAWCDDHFAGFVRWKTAADAPRAAAEAPFPLTLAVRAGLLEVSAAVPVNVLVIFGGGKHTFLSLRSPDRVPVPRELAAAGCAAVIVRRV